MVESCCSLVTSNQLINQLVWQKEEKLQSENQLKEKLQSENQQSERKQLQSEKQSDEKLLQSEKLKSEKLLQRERKLLQNERHDADDDKRASFKQNPVLIHQMTGLCFCVKILL
ncbi:MAG TPA: hypothetical protein QF620_00695 [Candidatus Paceibacterota bacterium]|jgi:hypothetical protein|nr:hypothetical protein [Candidatus Paceibacterota bacterium]MDP7159364.1 hypothetical protein [Candidatus Paceibacterota bacterium]MDP7648534.1 hypothetical protein [Candidatus Paceibacterota bacterium]HJO89681.1 hypothetical protein [Candidatus Paceibacterota bacterium]